MNVSAMLTLAERVVMPDVVETALQGPFNEAGDIFMTVNRFALLPIRATHSERSASAGRTLALRQLG